MGDYYIEEDDKKAQITVAVNTASKCDGLKLILKQKGSQKDEYIQSFQVKEINGNFYSSEESTYKVYSHFFFLKNLQEGQRYYYKLNNNLNDFFHFVCPYVKGNQNKKDNHVLVYGDYDANIRQFTKRTEEEGDWGESTHRYLNKIVKDLKNGDSLPEEYYDQQLFLGDMTYDIIDNDYRLGDQYFRKVEQYYAQLPQIISLGNHESGNWQESFGYKFVNDYFYLPDYKKYKNFNFNYDLISAQLVNYNAQPMAYNDEEGIQKSLENLEEQLKIAHKRRSKRPFLIVISHYPMYACDVGGCELDYDQFIKVEELLKKYKVDLYLSAHVHDYQRYHPIYKKKLCEYVYLDNSDNKYYNLDCPIHVVEGQAGQAYYHPVNQKQEDREIQSKYITNIPGVGKLSVFNSTHLRYQHINTDNEEIVDEFWIVKDEGDNILWIIIIISVGILLILAIGITIKLIKRKKLKQQQQLQQTQNNLSVNLNTSNQNMMDQQNFTDDSIMNNQNVNQDKL